eukprot:UN30623
MMEEPGSPLSTLNLPMMVTSTNANPAQTNNVAPSVSDETLSHVSSITGFPPVQNSILTPPMFPYNSHGVTMSPLGGAVVSVENLQTAWVAPGTNLAYVPQPRIYSPAPPGYVPYAQPLLTPTPPPQFNQYQSEFQHQSPSQSPPRPKAVKNERKPHFSSPQLKKRTHTPYRSRTNRRFRKKECFKTFPEENEHKKYGF